LPDRFSSQKIREFAVTVFQKLNYSREEAEQISDVIITSDLFGIESHGCQRLKLYTDGVTSIGRIKQGKKPEVLRETPVAALIEGHEYHYSIAEIEQYYTDVVNSVDIGVIVYNIPQFTGISFSKTPVLSNNRP
jgi:hypothetical protein